MKSHARWAVAQVLAGDGDEGDARALLSKTDPLTRSRARRHLQDQVEAIYIAKPEAASGRGLLEEVAGNMGVTASRKKAPFWWPTTIASLVVVAAGGLIAFLVATREPADTGKSIFKKVPEVADAYENGGRPLSLGPVGEELFGERFADFVIAAARHARERTSLTELDLDKAQRKMTDEKYKSALGNKAFAALVGLAEAARVTLEDGESIWGDAGELNDALAEAGLGYYVDDSTIDYRSGTSPMLYTHVVERVRIYDIGGGQSERVLWLRRLDKINRRKTATASTHAEANVAILRRNHIDESVFERLMPMLKPDTAYSLWPVQPSRPRPVEKDQLESRAGEKMREELAAAGVEPEDGARVAKLLGARDDLVADLGSRARQKNYRLALPTGYLFDVSRFKRLEPVIGTGILPEIEKLNKQLSAEENRAVYARVRAAVVEAVEFHEVQHRLDYKREPLVPPSDLVKYLKKGVDGGELSRFGRRLILEYSAYLSSIANSKVPFTTLVRLTWFSFDEDGWNSTYADTSVAIVESLCRVAGIEHGPFIDRRNVVRAELARAMIKLFEKSPSELSALAKEAWESSFQLPLVKPVRRVR